MGVSEALQQDIWLTRVVLDDYDVRGALLLGERHALVWDTLSRPRDMRAYLPFLAGRELVIVYSHADWDHVWGTAGLDYEGVRVVGHRSTQARFSTDVPEALAGKRAAEPERWDTVVLVPPTEVFDDELSIPLGSMTLQLHHLPGHTADCIVGFIPERGVLLAGDTVETPCPVVPADSALGEWIARLRQWADHPQLRTVVPAHGPVGGRDLVLQNIAYLESIANGAPLEPRGPLTDFYRTTHQQNIRWSPPAAAS